MFQLKLFVSYAHDDFKPTHGFKESRIGRLFNDIKDDLNCHSRQARFKMLRDREDLLHVSNPVHKTLDEAIKLCDAGLMLLSDNYLASPECLREFDLLVELGKPLFLVEVEDVRSGLFAHTLEKHKAQVDEVLRSEFWGMVGSEKCLYGWPNPQHPSAHGGEQYIRALKDLIAGIKKIAVERFADGPVPAGGRCAVFLAAATGDVDPDARRLTKSLERDGHAVASFDPKLDLAPGDNAERLLKDRIERCDIYIQLLGGIPGRRLGGDGGPALVPAQYRAAESLGKPVYLWRNPEFDIADCDPAYADFLAQLASHDTSIEDFERYVRGQANELHRVRQATDQKAERERREKEEGIPPSMAIDVDASDGELATKIRRSFEEYVDVVTLPYQLSMSDLEKAIDDHDAMIVGYGASETGQKRAISHFTFIRKRNANSKRFKLAVGDAAPPGAPQAPRGPNVHVIAIGEDIDRPAMMKFLERLGVPAERPSELH